MTNLFLCKTPYQIMVVTQLILTEFLEDTNDILIGDTITSADVLLSNMKKVNIFNNVSLHPSESRFEKISKYMYITYAIKAKLHLKNDIVDIDCKYDRFLFCNLSSEETLIYRELLNKNKSLKVFLFEDGFATYSKMYGSFFYALKFNKSPLHNIKALYKRIRYGGFLKLSGVYLFSPELLDWKPDAPVKPIKKINPDNLASVNVFNKMFGATNLEDAYDEKFIFFEESYYADGKDVGDMDIVDNISDIVGKEKMFVKIHPRNPVNRFSKNGYKTNKNTTIPWEIVALNLKIGEKILLTIASGSALTSLVNVSTKPEKIIMFMNCEEMKEKELTPSLEMLRKIALKNSDVVVLPNNIQELKNILKELT